ncbi:hypothetical protein SAMN06893096_103476 [Geodermatophilus pulveris]|uniref:DNA-binding domain-containing protein n=1 Tax=Geodermatophilus pulveris TaxID=1564159 RepID=A0A239E1C4_9ACTN|nr:hypothetical protein SAMN06893096_103476 [Geodermatophilus pulveris]
MRRLVEAVVNANPNDESRSVEWKSTLDLSHRNGAFHIARCILGLANRHPPHAEHEFGGVGYMIVGAEPNNLVGITPIDPVDLDNKLSPYLSTRHPSWSSQYISIDGKQVLVVLVEPPKWGDEIWQLRKEWSDGKRVMSVATIFVRGLANTAPADDGDLDKLQERLLRRATETPRLDLDVSYEGPPLVRLDSGAEAVARWIQARGDLLRAWTLNERDERIVGLHLAECKRRIRGLYLRRLAIFGQDLQVIVRNPTTRNLPQVQIVLWSSDPGFLKAMHGNEALPDRLPLPPQGGGVLGLTSGLELPTGETEVEIEPTHITIENFFEKPPIVRLLLGDVRPHGEEKSVSFYLFAKRDAGDAIKFNYRLTSTGVDAVQEGTFVFPVAPEISSLERIVTIDERMG